MTTKQSKQQQEHILTIDLSQWATISQYARETGNTLNNVSQQLRRTRTRETANPLTFWDIPSLGITLIRRD